MPVEPSKAAKALAYAENTLGVHTTHEVALNARDRLDKTLTELSERRDLRREREEKLRDREWELASEAWAANPDFSATKMEQYLKGVRHSDDVCRDLRQQIAAQTSDIEGMEYDKSMLETDIKIAVARLHELGGYFEYLAAIKQADSANRNQ